MASLRNLAIGALRLADYTNIAAGLRPQVAETRLFTVDGAAKEPRVYASHVPAGASSASVAGVRCSGPRAVSGLPASMTLLIRASSLSTESNLLCLKTLPHRPCRGGWSSP